MAYMLLSNIYCCCVSSWDFNGDVKQHKEDYRVVKKYCGWTWIEWNDEVYTFLLNDQDHLETKKICGLCDFLGR